MQTDFKNIQGSYIILNMYQYGATDKRLLVQEILDKEEKVIETNNE